jgi:hypothetical protein
VSADTRLPIEPLVTQTDAGRGFRPAFEAHQGAMVKLKPAATLFPIRTLSTRTKARYASLSNFPPTSSPYDSGRAGDLRLLLRRKQLFYLMTSRNYARDWRRRPHV